MASLSVVLEVFLELVFCIQLHPMMDFQNFHQSVKEKRISIRIGVNSFRILKLSIDIILSILAIFHNNIYDKTIQEGIETVNSSVLVFMLTNLHNRKCFLSLKKGKCF